MIYANRSTPFEAVTNFGTSGLVGTLGVRIIDNEGNTVTARTTAGIIEEPASSAIYETTLTAPIVNGQYSVVWDDGAGNWSEEGLVVINTVPVPPIYPPPPSSGSGPILGPCESWIDGADVMACCPVDPGSAGAAALDEIAVAASTVLFEISGRQFPGVCERTVRPCQDPCGCWGSSSTGLGPWSWSAASWGAGGTWGWWNECGDRCGCGSLSEVRLAGYPVREIVEVKIDGEVLDPVDGNGNPNYRLDGWRRLVRMDDPEAGARRWPACQNMALDDTEDGTFSVTYWWGTPPPELGRRAAAQLACQLVLSCAPAGEGADCVLPSGATRIVRQGVEVDRGVLLNWFDPLKPTGLVDLDTFLVAYWPDRKARRTPAVWSPDVQPFARRLGTSPAGTT